jgi:hypothetical protein
MTGKSLVQDKIFYLGSRYRRLGKRNIRIFIPEGIYIYIYLLYIYEGP